MELRHSIEVSNKYGLHARTSTRLSQMAKQFESSILVSKDEIPDEVDAKSILGILTLGVAKGERLHLRIVGEDAEQALAALITLIENFQEEDRVESADSEEE